MDVKEVYAHNSTYVYNKYINLRLHFKELALIKCMN